MYDNEDLMLLLMKCSKNKKIYVKNELQIIWRKDQWRKLEEKEDDG
jgi:hypothetical protein